MKNLILFTVLIAMFMPVVFCAVSSPVRAEEYAELKNPIGDYSGTDSIDQLVKIVIRYVLSVSGVAALIAFVYGGVWWLISLGDPNKVTKGKTIMIWAFLGLVFIFASYAIVTMVLGALGQK